MRASSVVLAAGAALAGALAKGAEAAKASRLLCPKGNFRSAELVFDCEAKDVTAHLSVASLRFTNFSVPAGITEARFVFQAPEGLPAVGLAVVDPLSHSVVAELPLALVGAATIVLDGGAGKVGTTTEKVWLGAGGSLESKGTNVSSAASAASGGVTVRVLRPSAGEAVLTLHGRLPRALEVRFATSGSNLSGADAGADVDASGGDAGGGRLSVSDIAASIIVVSYSYQGAAGGGAGVPAASPGVCGAGGAPPVGCAAYDALAAREAVYNWSSWVASEFNTSEQFWQELGLTSGESIPHHLWPAAWSWWPSSNESVVPWQAAFKYVDSLQVENLVVTFPEFDIAFGIPAVGLSLFTWCTMLHTFHPDQIEAWEDVRGPGQLDFARWKDAVWPEFKPLDNFHRASPEASFDYVDADNDAVITVKEFGSIWGQCHNGYHPVSSTLSTTLPATSTTTRTRTSTATLTSSSNASAVVADAAARAAGSSSTTTMLLAETTTTTTTVSSLKATKTTTSSAPPASSASISSDASSASSASNHSNTANASNATSPTISPTAFEEDMEPRLPPPPPQNTTAAAAAAPRCCAQLRAECLACQTNRTVSDFCSTLPGDTRVPGCQQAADAVIAVTDHAGPSIPDGPVGCPFDGFAFGPPLRGPGGFAGPGLTADVAACQASCLSLPGCAFFTYWRLDGACMLHDSGARWSPAPEAVSGPSACYATVSVHAPDVNLASLTEPQVRELRRRFVNSLSAAVGATELNISDLDGTPGSARIADIGDPRIAARVALPPGDSLANFSAWAIAGADGAAGSGTAAGGLRGIVEAAFGEVNATDLPGTSRTVVQGIDARMAEVCFLPGTRYEPEHVPTTDVAAELPFADTVEASGPDQCQAKCNQTAGCGTFSFSRAASGGPPKTKPCALLGSVVVAVRDPDSVAGPRECTPRPSRAAVAVLLSGDLGGGLRGGLSGGGDGGPAKELWAALDREGMAFGLPEDSERGWLLLGIDFLATFLFFYTLCHCWSRCISKRSKRAGQHDGSGPRYIALSREEPVEDEPEEDVGSAELGAESLNGSRGGAYARPSMDGDSVAGRSRQPSNGVSSASAGGGGGGGGGPGGLYPAFLGPESLSFRQNPPGASPIRTLPPAASTAPPSAPAAAGSAGSLDPNLSDALFSMLDRDHDGVVTRSEWDQALGVQRGAGGSHTGSPSVSSFSPQSPAE